VDTLHSLSLGLGDLLREHRRSNPKQTALVCGDARLRYPEMDARANRLASGLRARGFVGYAALDAQFGGGGYPGTRSR